MILVWPIWWAPLTKPWLGCFMILKMRGLAGWKTEGYSFWICSSWPMSPTFNSDKADDIGI
ncbi:hypothetical protein [Flavobacterium nitrogenifigens]|uniref:Uncharacterized protein n=1 Tax=Flavobacterium nitrogenifigens TaxID=1617283 RepID=A0A521F7M0_9FLAO|nr:hypothetical protein [Flavobacterium nitrogenifigens]KAF2337791.1 hypothetical protein DM397_03680 [Flavobacterium nitrogenifigens]SMO92195.1 hypothetical protein SAMN06265220_10727 [Flavobacterium nitrogenifigens]